MNAITSIIGDFIKSLKSKRVETGILTIVFMAAYNYFNLAEVGVSEDTLNNLVIKVAALIVGDTIRPVNPEKGGSERFTNAFLAIVEKLGLGVIHLQPSSSNGPRLPAVSCQTFRP